MKISPREVSRQYLRPPASQPVPETASQPVPETANQTVPETASQPVPESASQPVPETASQPVPETANQTVPDTASATAKPGYSTTTSYNDAITEEWELLSALGPQQGCQGRKRDEDNPLWSGELMEAMQRGDRDISWLRDHVDRG
eukprot:GHVR01052138.1.p2 GENE.GHVR01052138.1~~GHVR01052138.1.p2  ORF type:complete len:145 (+),score=32.32 GHVR01052138.1:539-973(+)